MPRFAIRTLEELTNEVRTICDHGHDPQDPLWLFLINRSLGTAYVRSGNLNKAGRLWKPLRKQVETDASLGLGPLHRTMFWKAYARYRDRVGDQGEWAACITRALDTAARAGLTHQASAMQQEYGRRLNPLLDQLAPLADASLSGEGHSIAPSEGSDID